MKNTTAPDSGKHNRLYTSYSYLPFIINQIQQQNVIYFKHLVGLKINCDVHVELNPGLSWQKLHSTRKWTFSPPNWIEILSKVPYGAENWTLWKLDRKYLETFERWFWRRMDISWTHQVVNTEVLRLVKTKNKWKEFILELRGLERRMKTEWNGGVFKGEIRTQKGLAAP